MVLKLSPERRRSIICRLRSLTMAHYQSSSASRCGRRSPHRARRTSNYLTQPWALCGEIMSLRRHMGLTPGSQCYSLEMLVCSRCERKGFRNVPTAQQGYPYNVVRSGAYGSIAPVREPSREASRSVGFNPIAQQVSKNEALLSRSPGAVGPASRRRTRRRRYADALAAAQLTGLATADWPPLRCGTDALFLFES